MVADDVGRSSVARRPDSVEVPGRTIGGDTEHAADEQRGRHQTGDRSTTRVHVTAPGPVASAVVASSARRQPQDRVELGDREQQHLLHEVGSHRRRQPSHRARPIASADSHHGHATHERDVEQRRRQTARSGGEVERCTVGPVGQHVA